jgi:cell division protein FtsN
VSYRFLAGCVLSLGVVFSLGGCISSEETGAGDRARSPVHTIDPIDTMQRTISHQDALASKNNLKFSEGSTSRVAPKFKSKQDTVRASVVKKSKGTPHPRIIIERPEHPVYTVQIGAFGQASNALRRQKKAKERFPHQPVFNKYLKNAKLYRVSVGRYEDRKDAFALADTMKQDYFKEYGRCWINFIP